MSQMELLAQLVHSQKTSATTGKQGQGPTTSSKTVANRMATL